MNIEDRHVGVYEPLSFLLMSIQGLLFKHLPITNR